MAFPEVRFLALSTSLEGNLNQGGDSMSCGYMWLGVAMLM